MKCHPVHNFDALTRKAFGPQSGTQAKEFLMRMTMFLDVQSVASARTRTGQPDGAGTTFVLARRLSDRSFRVGCRHRGAADRRPCPPPTDILFEQGILDAYGHVSVRSLKNPKHYFLSRSRAPGLVTRADIMEFDENSNPVDQQGRPMYSERFIHGEIFRAHPEVEAIVHSHAASVPSVQRHGIRLRPILHMAGFLPQAVPMFEIRNVAGPDNGMLVSDQRPGSGAGSIARRLTGRPDAWSRNGRYRPNGSACRISRYLHAIERAG